MKKFFLIAALSVAVAACSKKVTSTTYSSDNAMSTTTADAPKLGKEAAAGMDTYNAKCGRCHALKKVENYTAKEWVPILDDMAVKAKLSAEEKSNVLAYVQFYAKAS